MCWFSAQVTFLIIIIVKTVRQLNILVKIVFFQVSLMNKNSNSQSQLYCIF